MRRAAGALLVVVALAVTTVASEPTPEPARAGAPVAVAFVGDSIGRDAEPEVRAAVAPTPITYYHAIAAGYTSYHRPLLLEQVRKPNGPDIVVAELGTGDAFWSHGARRFEAEMRRTLNKLRPHVECVIWIDQKSSDNRAFPMINERYRKLNDVVHRVVQDYDFATYLHYAHWTELAGSPSPYFLADWLHLTQAGERELGRLVASAVRGCDESQVSGPFWDVPDSFWAADAIEWAAAEGIVTGYDNDTYRAVVGQFKPALTRGQGLSMVWRLAGSPQEPEPHGFVDGRPALRRALRWGRATGVATGYRDGTYRPDAPLTRGALLMMLWKAVERPGGLPAHPWTQTVPPRLRNAVRWAVTAELVDGTGPSARHRARVNRAQAAVWLQAADAWLDPPSPAPPAPPTSSPPTTAPVTTAGPPTTASATTPAPPTTATVPTATP